MQKINRYGIQGIDTFVECMKKEEEVLQFFQDLNLFNLRTIKIENCDEFLEHSLDAICRKNSNLRHLSIPNTLSKFGFGLDALSSCCISLETLFLDNSCLSNKKLEFLKNFQNLRNLSLKRTKIADETIKNIVKNNSKMSKIDLLHCNKITKEGATYIVKEAKNLKYLNLVGTKVNSHKGWRIYVQFGQFKKKFLMYC